MKRLILMRHAKSDWQGVADSDYDRPLNKRGRRAAVDIGAILRKKIRPPDRVISSPALRARQTVERLFLQTGWRLDRLRFEESLYLAGVEQLLALIHGESSGDTVMLVGHNPGMEELLVHLCGPDISRTKKGKLFTTANVALIEPNERALQRPGSARLIELIRPR